MLEADSANNEILAANSLLKDYFGHFVFHDCSVLSITYDPICGTLSIAISLDLFEADLSRPKETNLIFGRVLNVVFNNHPTNLVDSNSIDFINWKNHLNPKHSRKEFSFSDCRFADSEYNDFSMAKMKKRALKAVLTFDNWIKIAVDFLDFKVVLPKGLSRQKLLRVAEKYWNQE